MFTRFVTYLCLNLTFKMLVCYLFGWICHCSQRVSQESFPSLLSFKVLVSHTCIVRLLNFQTSFDTKTLLLIDLTIPLVFCVTHCIYRYCHDLNIFKKVQCVPAKPHHLKAAVYYNKLWFYWTHKTAGS